MQNESTESKKNGRSYQSDLICLFCLTVFVIAVFFSTIFSGKDISRIGTVAHRDTVFGRLAKGAVDPMDTCIYQEHAPNYLLTERVIAGGSLPLWNPYLGFGCPLWADSQILAFSPITWLQAPFASLRLYNLLMVFHVWIGCVGAYVLARLLRISAPGSLLSAISYAFCPNLLYMFEWNRCQSAFFPLPFLGFALLWRRSNSSSIVFCALLCTAMVVSGHAVPTFFAILLASIMYLALAFFMPQEKHEDGSKTPFSEALKNFLVTGVLTFLLSAPFIVPFINGVRASDCFKSSQGYVRYVVRETALLPSLLFPFHGPGSVYPGAISITLALSAVFISKKNRRLIAILSALALLTICILIRPGPFDLLFQLPGLNWFMVIYALPALLLLIGVLAGAGYDALLEEEARIRSAVIATLVVLVAVCMPFVVGGMHLTDQQMRLNDWLTTMTVSSAVRVRELVFLLLALLVIFSLSKLSSNFRAKIAIALIVLNVVSLGFIIRKSLPARPAFAYEELEPISFLKAENRRILSMGRHVLVPNTSQIFAIANLVSFMPTHPRGVLDYLSALGVTIEGVGQYAEKPLTKLVDAASVKFLVSSEPVLSSDDKLPDPIDIGTTGGVRFGSEVKLLGCALSVDLSNFDVVGKLKWNAQKPNTNFLYLPMLVKEDGSLLWIGDMHSLTGATNPTGSAIETLIAAVIPKSLKSGQSVCLIMQVLDSSTGRLVEPQNIPAAMQIAAVPQSILLKKFAVPYTASISVSGQRHFKFVKETAPEMVRVYENSGCMPEAYLVSATRKVESIEQAIEEMLKPGFDPRKEALTEGVSVLPAVNDAVLENLDKAKVKRPSINEVEIEVEATRPSLLVLADVCFPGWRAEVDGREAEIHRANAIFRSVRVESGRHVVRFVFDPIDVKIGFFLFVLGLGAIVALLRFGKKEIS